MKKRKVMHILSSNNFSGAENVVCTIIENNKKYDMYYCCPRGPIEDILKERKIKYIPIAKLTPFAIKKVCKQNEIDILHAHDFKASFCAGLSGFKGRIISHLHANWKFSSSWNIYTILYNFFIKKFYKVITVSQEIVEDAVFSKKHIDKFVVISNVVDKKRVLEKSREFKTDEYDLIFVGRINDIKQPNVIIEITKELVKKYSKIKTCMIGNGELEETCKTLIKEYNLENNIDMLGFMKNPFPYIKNSKVALLPSKHEGLPMSVIECMILDVPVLNSGVGGMAMLFKDDKKFICNSIEQYCDTISKILEGDSSYRDDCQRIIKDATDMSYYIEQINKVYK